MRFMGLEGEKMDLLQEAKKSIAGKTHSKRCIKLISENKYRIREPEFFVVNYRSSIC